MNPGRILPVIIILLISVWMPAGYGDIVERDGVIEHWTISPGDTVVLNGVEKIVDGQFNLHGTLTLDNSTLRIWSNATIYQMGHLNLLNGSILEFNSSSSLITFMGSSITILNSTARNSFFMGSDIEIRGSKLENSSAWIDRWDIVRDSTFSNGSIYNPVALFSNPDSKASVTNVTIRDYSIGVRVLTEGFELIDSTIENCDTGISAESEHPLYITQCRIKGRNVSIFARSSMYIKGSTLLGGSVFLSGSSLFCEYTDFLEMKGISGINFGFIKNSTFRNCEYGLRSPSDVTVTGSLFSNCDIAIDEPSGALIYHNSFIDNGNVVMGVPDSEWYNDARREGNFYSGYHGSDDGSNDGRANDGIGDTNIPYLGRDKYPLMKDELWNMPRIKDLKMEYARGSGTVNLSWSDDEGTGAIVQRSPSPDFDLDVISWSVTDSLISIRDNPNSTLHFRVGVFNDFGYRGWSAFSKVTVDQVPLPPARVTVGSPDGGSSLLIGWKQDGEDIERTFVLISPVGGKVNTVPVEYPADEIQIGGLKNGVVYNISLVNEDHSGQLSIPSENITGTPVDIVPAPPPRSLRGEPVSNTSIEIFWDPPLVQDISNYLMYRRSQDSGFDLIANISRLTISYVDRGLMDNVTYTYAMRSVDDDGPISALSGEVSISTLHYNREPVFSGFYQYVPLVEDQGPFQISMEDLVSDPDGDDIIVHLQDHYRVKAEIIDEVLWIIPAEDQAGSGFVNLLASDGEMSTFFVIGVMIEEVPDPPQDVIIISPENGSVILPGSQILFQADAFDPDVPYGDNLTYRWRSDRDGSLNGNGTLSEHIYRSLSPGVHEITLTVYDRNYSRVIRKVTVIVSLWGWGDLPWSVSILSTDVSENGGYTKIRIYNQATIRLTFTISPADIATIPLSREKRITIPPSSSAEIDLEIRPPLSPGAVIFLNWSMEAETINGTFAGQGMISESSVVEKEDGGDESSSLVMVLMVISAVLTIVAVIGVIVLGMSGRRSTIDQNIEDEPSHRGTEAGESVGR